MKFRKLKGRMAENGITTKELSKKTGIPISTLSMKLNGITEFKVSEIVSIATALNIADVKAYFFTN